MKKKPKLMIDSKMHLIKGFIIWNTRAVAIFSLSLSVYSLLLCDVGQCIGLALHSLTENKMVIDEMRHIQNGILVKGVNNVKRNGLEENKKKLNSHPKKG